MALRTYALCLIRFDNKNANHIYIEGLLTSSGFCFLRHPKDYSTDKTLIRRKQI